MSSDEAQPDRQTIKMDLREIRRGAVKWIQLTEDRVQWRVLTDIRVSKTRISYVWFEVFVEVL
jgi:hypothetical protein